MPRDRLLCPLHGRLHGTSLGCTQPCCSKPRFILLTQRLPAPETLIMHHNPDYTVPSLPPPCPCTPAPLGTNCTRWSWLAHKSHIWCLLGRIPLLQHKDAYQPRKGHLLWGGPGTGKAQQPRFGTPYLSSLHMPQLACPAPAPSFLLTCRDSASTETLYSRLSNSTVLACPCPPAPICSNSQGNYGLSSQLPTGSAALNTPKAAASPRSQSDPSQHKSSSGVSWHQSQEDPQAPMH